MLQLPTWPCLSLKPGIVNWNSCMPWSYFFQWKFFKKSWKNMWLFFPPFVDLYQSLGVIWLVLAHSSLCLVGGHGVPAFESITAWNVTYGFPLIHGIALWHNRDPLSNKSIFFAVTHARRARGFGHLYIHPRYPRRRCVERDFSWSRETPPQISTP